MLGCLGKPSFLFSVAAEILESYKGRWQQDALAVDATFPPLFLELLTDVWKGYSKSRAAAGAPRRHPVVYTYSSRKENQAKKHAQLVI